MIANVMRLVRDNDHCPVPSPFEELVGAAIMKARIANSDDLINEEAVEFHGHRQREGETCAHSRGIGFDGLAQVIAELRKSLDVGDDRGSIHIIHAGDEMDVVDAGKAALKCTGECQGPGDRHCSVDGPAVGRFGSAD